MSRPVPHRVLCDRLPTNTPRGTRPELAERTVAEPVPRYEEDVERLARLFPELDLTLWPNFRHLADAARDAGDA